jgi:hypothetical protein
MGVSDSTYQLGSNAAELERLDQQGRLLAPATRGDPESRRARVSQRRPTSDWRRYSNACATNSRPLKLCSHIRRC